MVVLHVLFYAFWGENSFDSLKRKKRGRTFLKKPSGYYWCNSKLLKISLKNPTSIGNNEMFSGLMKIKLHLLEMPVMLLFHFMGKEWMQVLRIFLFFMKWWKKYGDDWKIFLWISKIRKPNACWCYSNLVIFLNEFKNSWWEFLLQKKIENHSR
jgi:hypothetical protein